MYRGIPLLIAVLVSIFGYSFSIAHKELVQNKASQVQQLANNLSAVGERVGDTKIFQVPEGADRTDLLNIIKKELVFTEDEVVQFDLVMRSMQWDARIKSIHEGFR
jgi:maltodextrin utilization protein YvdJ